MNAHNTTQPGPLAQLPLHLSFRTTCQSTQYSNFHRVNCLVESAVCLSLHCPPQLLLLSLHTLSSSPPFFSVFLSTSSFKHFHCPITSFFVASLVQLSLLAPNEFYPSLLSPEFPPPSSPSLLRLPPFPLSLFLPPLHPLSTV